MRGPRMMIAGGLPAGSDAHPELSDRRVLFASFDAMLPLGIKCISLEWFDFHWPLTTYRDGKKQTRVSVLFRALPSCGT